MRHAAKPGIAIESGLISAAMEDFDAIRPYRDDEVPAVVARLAEDADLRHAASLFFLPRLARWAPALARLLTGRFLQRKAARLRTVDDLQALLSGYLDALIGNTVVEFSVSGLRELTVGQPHLFVSTHRDIVMDTGLMNYAIHRAGHDTTRIAVGDNLLGKPYAADLMRLNKSFVIQRGLTGAKAVYRSRKGSAAFIRASLEEHGQSVWIAQREGRSKDGLDRTDPALFKMLALAYGRELGGPGQLGERIPIVPVAITYEVDPCALRKARELYLRDLHGKYDKQEGEDLASLVEGMLGFKGRVHVHFGGRVAGGFESAEPLAAEVDRRIVGGLRVFPTHLQAARRLGLQGLPPPGASHARADAAFDAQLRDCPPPHLDFLLNQYANLVRNKQAFGELPAADAPGQAGEER